MSNPLHPVPGDLVIDASDLTVYDLTPAQIKKKIKVRDGFEEAVGCLVRLEPEEVKQAGLNPDDIAASTVLLAQYERAQEVLPAAEKLAELLRETKIETGHRIGVILGNAASQVRRRAERDPDAAELLGKLSDLLTYVSAPAKKAAVTRNKAAKDDSAPPAPSGDALPPAADTPQ